MLPMKSALLLAIFIVVACAALQASAQSGYMIGSGIHDITGPAYGLGMMGYAMPQQWTHGIHTRLRARAYVIAQGSTRVVFVSSDLCFTTQAVKQTVVERLKKVFGPTLYREENVMLSATHTHAGPGGYSWHPLYDISTFGFHDQNFNAIVNGIVAAIIEAHNNLAPGTLSMNKGEIMDSNANRSPSAYLGNPPEERAQYQYNTDKDLTVLRFTQLNGSRPQDVGVIGWFAVHGTSMNNTNKYISGDNKGYASYLFEKVMNNGALPGTGPFVAAFGQSNEGDVTPNVRGAFCDNGMPCEVAHSTCGGWSEGCHGYGPGKTDFESTRMIGLNQFQSLKKYFDITTKPVQGGIRYMHTWVNMEDTVVSPEYTGIGRAAKTCVGALGDSFAAGTTDGPGEFNFIQGTNDTSSNWYWNWLTSKILAAPTPEDISCHSPKPILFMTGRILFPGKWSQGIIPIQLFNIGQLWIIGVPGEFSTMAGRRLRNKVTQAIQAAGGWSSDSQVVIAGLTNSYTHYITTREEYAYQRYEGASTMFGPFTLNAYEMLYSDLANRIVKGINPPVSAIPENISSAIFYLQPGVSVDKTPSGISFGQVAVDANPTYSPLNTVTVRFWSGNPRNNLHLEGTYLNIMKKNAQGGWDVIANDGDWETKYWFEYVTPIGGQARIEWDIPAGTRGTFKIVHYGDAKTSETGALYSFTGQSREFTVA